MLVLYDLSAAFDTISHQTLLKKLEIYGFQETALAWMTSYLSNRKQSVTVKGKSSEFQDMNIGTPQGSRLSPLAFVCFMADLDIHVTRNCKISQFADDTQSLCVEDNLDTVIKNTIEETTNVINYFSVNDLVNNSDKAALLYNTKGKGESITLKISGEEIKSKETEKLLGLNISSDFTWKKHCEKIAVQLNQRVGMLRRMKQRIPIEKLIIIAQAIVNSKIFYGSSVYLQPVFEKEEVKTKYLPAETRKLQVIQNNMLRMIFGIKLEDQTNMTKLRENIKIFSVNQMCCYQVLIEAFNVIHHRSADTIYKKWMPQEVRKYPLRRDRQGEVKVIVPHHEKCKGFTWYGAKFWNQLPVDVRDIKDSEKFKNAVKEYIWDTIPSY